MFAKKGKMIFFKKQIQLISGFIITVSFTATL